MPETQTSNMIAIQTLNMPVIYTLNMSMIQSSNVSIWILAILFKPFVLLAPMTFNYFWIEHTWWLFQKRLVRTKLDIYIFIQEYCKVEYLFLFIICFTF